MSVSQSYDAQCSSMLSLLKASLVIIVMPSTSSFARGIAH